MGKCSKCGKRIEYNNFIVVDGIVYHKECAPKKEAAPEEQFEAEVNEMAEDTIANDPDTEDELKKKKKNRERNG